MIEPPDFGPMFRAGTRYSWDDGSYSVIDVPDAGTLNLATGRLVAQDPWWGAVPPQEPFAVTVPPGRYPVTLSVSHWDQSPTPGVESPLRLVNAARLTLSDKPVVSWEVAVRAGQDAGTLVDDDFYTLGVDGGMGCFLDASAIGQLDVMEELDAIDNDDAIRRVGAVIDQRGSTDLPTHDPDLNIIVFGCGMGDGGYATWIGRAADGNVACFVSDLELLSHSLGPAAD